jgi:RNA polymerase sigma-70 factor, ECF subfamily
MQRDTELLQQIRLGEMGAFDVLYERYAVRLLSYIHRFVGDRAAAEDLVQEVFLAVLKDQSFDCTKEGFARWVFTVARNRALNYQRDKKRNATKLKEFQTLARPIESSPATPRQGLSKGITQALSKLSPKHQDTLVLKQFGEFSYREIAEIQGVAEGTVKSRFHFAVRQLRQSLTTRGDNA